MTAGRLVAIVISFVVLLGGGYAAWRLNKDRQQHHVRLREAALRDNLFTMRKAIGNFHKDKGRYPRTLQELVPSYIRSIPADPITQSRETWRVTTEETVTPRTDFTTSTAASESYVVDVHSGAPPPYSEW